MTPAKISHLRLIVQTMSLITINLGLFGAAVLGTNLLPSGLGLPTLACHYFEGGITDCFIYQLQYYLTAGFESLQFLIMLALLIGIMCIVLGRIFCGWACPLGFIQDLCSQARKSTRIRYLKLSSNLNENLTQARYMILAIIAIISFFIGTEFVSAIYRRNLDLAWCQICPAKPVFLFSQSVLAIIKWPSFLPMGWGNEKVITLLSIFSLVIFAVGSFAVRRFWCRFCPMGGLISLFKGFSAPYLSKETIKCKKCGICSRSCPLQISEVYEAKNDVDDVTSAKCTLCLRCIEMCPEENCLKLNFMGRPIYTSKSCT